MLGFYRQRTLFLSSTLLLTAITDKMGWHAVSTSPPFLTWWDIATSKLRSPKTNASRRTTSTGWVMLSGWDRHRQYPQRGCRQRLHDRKCSIISSLWRWMSSLVSMGTKNVWNIVGSLHWERQWSTNFSKFNSFACCWRWRGVKFRQECGGQWVFIDHRLKWHNCKCICSFHVSVLVK